MPDAGEHKELVDLMGGPLDGEARYVDPDVLGLIVAAPDPDEDPLSYLRTRFVDHEERFVFVLSDLVGDPRALDPRLRRVL